MSGSTIVAAAATAGDHKCHFQAVRYRRRCCCSLRQIALTSGWPFMRSTWALHLMLRWVEYPPYNRSKTQVNFAQVDPSMT